jgi:hypothetical protein
MPASELLNQIRTEYCDQGPEQQHQAELLRLFCDYAAQWLVDRGCQGLGHAASGLTLRFADGTELALFTADTATIDTPAVAISMTADKTPRTVMADRWPSVGITGR